MNEWSVLVEAGADAPVTADDLEHLDDGLAEHSPSITGGGQPPRIGARIYVSATAADKAIAKAVKLFTQAATASNIPITAIEHVEATEWDRFTHDLEIPNFPELVGVTEIADLLGVQRQRVTQLMAKPDFPQPVTRLAAGPVWTRPSIQNFLDTWERKPGRPKQDPLQDLLANWPTPAGQFTNADGILLLGILAAAVGKHWLEAKRRRDGQLAIEPAATKPAGAPDNEQLATVVQFVEAASKRRRGAVPMLEIVQGLGLTEDDPQVVEVTEQMREIGRRGIEEARRALAEATGASPSVPQDSSAAG